MRPDASVKAVETAAEELKAALEALGLTVKLAHLATEGMTSLAGTEGAGTVNVVAARVVGSYASRSGLEKRFAHLVGMGGRHIGHHLAQHPLDGTQYATLVHTQPLGQDTIDTP